LKKTQINSGLGILQAEFSLLNLFTIPFKREVISKGCFSPKSFKKLSQPLIRQLPKHSSIDDQAEKPPAQQQTRTPREVSQEDISVELSKKEEKKEVEPLP